MTGEETLTASTTDPAAGHAAARWLCFVAALAGLAGSLWVALGWGTCNACHAAAARLHGFPLAWMGAAFYAPLAVAIASQGLARWTRTAFFAACGTHAVLLGLMAQEGTFCPGCLLAATGALAGGIACMLPRWRQAGALLAASAAAMLVTFATLRALEASRAAAVSPSAPPAGPSADVPKGHVKLIVYEREGCKHCLQFEEDELPQLKQALGPALEVERRDADVAMETPTIIVQGKDSQEFDGLPQYEDLLQAAREMEQ